VPYVADIKNPAVEDLMRGANRTLLYRTSTATASGRPTVFAETGTALQDP